MTNFLPVPLPGTTNTVGNTGTRASNLATLLSGMAPIRMISLGDSLAVADANNGASTIANMYMRKLAAYLGLGTTDGNGPGAPNGTNFVQSAISGIPIDRYMNASNRNLLISNSDFVTGLWSFNTMRFLGPDPASLQDMQMTIEGLLSWFCIPESLKIRVINVGTTTPNSNVVTTGTWAYFTMSAGTDLNQLALRGTSVNATATFPTVTGDTVYIWYARSTLGEAFTVSVDGVNYNVGGTVVYSTHLGVFNSWEVCVLRIGGLTNTTHTVVVTRSPSNANIVAIAGFNSNTIRAQCAAHLIGNCCPMISGIASEGYNFAGAAANDPFGALLTASAAWTPGAIAAGGTASTTVTVTGAALFDEVDNVAYSQDLQGLTLTAYVSAANTVAVRIFNGTGGSITPTAGNVRVRVSPQSGVGSQAVPFDYGDTGVRTYNYVLAQAVSNLQDDGLRVALIDIPSILNPAADAATDFVHFNDGGNDKLFRAHRRILSKAYGLS